MVATRSFSICWISSILGVSHAFQPHRDILRLRRIDNNRKEESKADILLFNSARDVEDYLAANYPACSSLLAKNADTMKKILKADDGFTIFAPNSDAFDALGEKKRSQLEDIRNAEVQ
jgi:uncharacterized surface protein with fasciclin (FAS1) repeats